MSTAPLRVVVGTAGHVDHGKTALVKALTGIDTDRLPEEKRRGITLEAGYAHLDLPGVGVAGVVDVPGHERFLRAMVAAAGGIDVAVLCVAADEGPMPQTAEHLDVLRLLGVQAGVIALTKSDLLPGLGAEHRELLTLELQELVKGTFLEEAQIVECSARTGKGLPELVAAIAAAVKARLAAPRPEAGPLFLPLDRSFAVKGFGTVVTGTLFSGTLSAGDEVDLVGAGATARGVRVRGLQVHGGAVEKARAGQRTAANLAGVEVSEAPRGAALIPAGTLESIGAAQMLDVELELLPCFLLRGELPRSTKEGAAQTRLTRGHASTLGGGRILSVAPRRRRQREADVLTLQALAGDDPLLQAERLLLESGYPGASPQRLAARGAFALKSAEKALERLAQAGRAVLFDREARLYAHAGVLQALEAKLLSRLRANDGAIDPSIAREELRQRAGQPPQKLYAKALTALAEKGELRADAERVHPPGVAAKLSGKDKDAQEKLAALLDQAGLQPPRTDELPALIEQPPPRTQALLKALAAAGRAAKISEDLWFGAAPLAELRRKLLAHLAAAGSVDAQSFKELTGLTRKFAIPLLEYFDRERVTLRIGDKRVLRKGER